MCECWIFAVVGSYLFHSIVRKHKSNTSVVAELAPKLYFVWLHIQWCITPQHLSFNQLSNLSKLFLKLPILATMWSICSALLLMGFICVITVAETLQGVWLSTSGISNHGQVGSDLLNLIKPCAPCILQELLAEPPVISAHLVVDHSPCPLHSVSHT